MSLGQNIVAFYFAIYFTFCLWGRWSDVERDGIIYTVFNFLLDCGFTGAALMYWYGDISSEYDWLFLVMYILGLFAIFLESKRGFSENFPDSTLNHAEHIASMVFVISITLIFVGPMMIFGGIWLWKAFFAH